MTDFENNILNNYKDIIDIYYSLYPKKLNSVNLTNDEIIKICNDIFNKINNSSTLKCNYYNNLLLSNKCKLFKAIKMSFIPKIKMELVLYIDQASNDSTRIYNINKLWRCIKNIFINIESSKINPNLDYIKYLESDESVNIDIKNDKQIDNIIKNFGMDKQELSSLLGNINISNKTIDNSLIREIIMDIKNSRLYKEIDTDKKLSINDIISGTQDLQDKYMTKLSSGDINISEFISSMIGLINNPEEYDKLIADLDLTNKIDSEMLVEEMISLLPDEYKSMAKMLKTVDFSNESSTSFNPLDLLNGLIGNTSNKITDLNEDQLEELDEFYSKLTI